MPSPGYQIGHDNREAVRTYLRAYPGIKNTEVGAALGLSVFAVGRHVNAIREEWLSRAAASPADAQSRTTDESK